MENSISMTYFAASMAEAMGVEAPEQAAEPIGLLRELTKLRAPEGIGRVLIYNPDAVGMWLFQKYTERFSPVLEAVQLGIPVRTVMPSVTPVCFGTMYTGVLPEIHGIMEYQKRMILTDSLFDSLARSGKKTALVAVANSSMAILFEHRSIDYYILPYDGEVSTKALELIEAGDYEVVVVYNQEYDDVMHKTYPESEESMAALGRHIQTFEQLTKAVKQHWNDKSSLVCWATDHGIHTNSEGRGTHGEALEEDLNVMHFFGVYPPSDQGQTGRAEK